MNLRNLSTWAVIYDAIRSELGFSFEEDLYAATIASLLSIPYGSKINKALTNLNELIRGSSVLVVGAANSCSKVSVLHKSFHVVIAADGALRCCLDNGVKPDVVVTDLDGISHKDLIDSAIYVVHAHGDNVTKFVNFSATLLKERLSVITVQVVPPPRNTYVFGGFTDGDRAVFTAYYFGAKRIGLVGFDFEGPVGIYSKPWIREPQYPTPIKRKKLIWAKRLLKLLRSIHGGEVDIEFYD